MHSLCQRYHQQQQRPGNLQRLLQLLKCLTSAILVQLVCQMPRCLQLHLYLQCRTSKQHQAACWRQTPVLLQAWTGHQLPFLKHQMTAQGPQQQPLQAAVRNRSSSRLTSSNSNSSWTRSHLALLVQQLPAQLQLMLQAQSLQLKPVLPAR